MTTLAAKFIDDRGGATAVSEMVGKKVGAVRVWKHRGILPRDHWPELLKAYPDLSLDDLLAIESGDAAAQLQAAS